MTKISEQHSNTLRELEQLSTRCGIILRYKNLSKHEFKVKSGYCRLRGENLIIIDKSLSAQEKIKVLRKELAKIDSENIYIEPRLRELIWF